MEVTAAALAKRYEGNLLEQFDEDYIDEIIADALDMILDECPGIEARVASGGVTQRTLERVVTDVVFRDIRNPEGYSNEAEGNYSYTVSKLVASGDLWLSDKDRKRLKCPCTTAPMGTVSIGLDRGWGR